MQPRRSAIAISRAGSSIEAWLATKTLPLAPAGTGRLRGLGPSHVQCQYSLVHSHTARLAKPTNSRVGRGNVAKALSK